MKINNRVSWAARILSVVFALFMSIFAMDVFSENTSFGNMLLALCIHLIPTFIILLILLFSWRWEWIGATAYLLLGILYIFFANKKMDWTAYVLISGPLFVLGILFLIAWRQKIKKKKSL
jgi:chromate transport protein ChrA